MFDKKTSLFVGTTIVIVVIVITTISSINSAAATTTTAAEEENEVLGIDAQEQDYYKVKVIADNLKVPWQIAFSPDGRIFFTERGGQLRIIDGDGKLLEEPAKILDVGAVEGGLLGIALDTNFEENHFVYLYYTYSSDFIFTYNRVSKFVEEDNRLTDEQILVDKIPGGPIHDGGRIKFGPDGKLYITTGEAGNPHLAQDLNSLGGKILRINADGTIPQDNPFEGSPIFSYGHRNPQGVDWDPATQKLVITEHGPSGEMGFAHDEINVIKPGQNYGWPKVIGDETEPGLQSPLIHSGTETWAPSGATFYTSDNIPEWEGKFFFANLRGAHLRVLDLDLENNVDDDDDMMGKEEGEAKEQRVVSTQVLFKDQFGRLRDAAIGPDGNLYLLTSNRDGRGSPDQNDDKILKIMPKIDERKGEEVITGGGEKETESVNSLFDPPLMQIRKGIEPAQVKCDAGKELLLKKTDGKPICVYTNTAEELLKRGWAVKGR